MKLGAKQAELVQKFVPRSRVETFCNELTRSTPLDPRLMFSCISYYFIAIGTVWLRYETHCKTGRTIAKVRATKSRRNFHNERTGFIPLDPKQMFWCVSNYLGAFWTVWLPYETRCKTGQKVQKFVPRSCIRIFRNEHAQSTPLDPKLMFWSVSYYLGTFGTVWLPYETWCKTGRTSAKVRATKSRRNFSQRTHPIRPSGP
jgi:hypothetical protein